MAGLFKMTITRSRKVTANAFEAVGMLNKSKVITPDLDHAQLVAWARDYRAARASGRDRRIKDSDRNG